MKSNNKGVQLAVPNRGHRGWCLWFVSALTVRASESRASSLPWMLCRAQPNSSERKGLPSGVGMQWWNQEKSLSQLNIPNESAQHSKRVGSTLCLSRLNAPRESAQKECWAWCTNRFCLDIMCNVASEVVFYFIFTFIGVRIAAVDALRWASQSVMVVMPASVFLSHPEPK